MFHGTYKFLLLLGTLLYMCGCSGGEPISPARHSGDLPGAIGSMHDEIPDQPEFVEGEVLVVLNDGIWAASMNPIADQLGLSPVKKTELMWGTVYRMRIDSGETVESMVATLITYPEVKYAEPNYILYPMGELYFPQDPLFESDIDGDDDSTPWSSEWDQWAPNAVGASLCWPHTKGDGVVIASPDTGVRITHEDLKNQLWINEDEIPDNGIDDDDNGYIDDIHGWSYKSDSGEMYDYHEHGTGCAGIFVAEQDNHKGCSGISPGGKVMPLAIVTETDILEALQYAYDNDADILSFAIGFEHDSQILHDQVTSIWDEGKGVLMTGAAGNGDWGPEVIYPAAWPEVIATGSTTSYSWGHKRADTQRSYWSCYGENLEIMAPGENIISTCSRHDSAYFGIDTYYVSGTSCSTQVVAGCLALMMSENPDLTHTQLRQRLNETCDDLYEPGYDLDSGWGQANVYRAIYGSDPNADVYDANGHIPHPGNNKWFFDNIFDISTSADYDFEDIFILDCDENGVFRLTVDIITTGEDFDMELYDNPELAGTPVAVFYGPNGEDKPVENIEFLVTQGEKYYLRVFSAGPYNCSNYGVRFDSEPYCWWLESESLAPDYVHGGSDVLQLIELEFHTTLSVTPERIVMYIAGTIPLRFVNYLILYEDSNDSGEWEAMEDEAAAYAVPSENPVSQVVFDNLDANASSEAPLRYFVIADVGPNLLPFNIMAGVGIHSYKDVKVMGAVPLKDDPFPVISEFTEVGEIQPPEWDTTTGVQATKGLYTAVAVYWNNATDIGNEPTSYNVYWDDSFPPDISTDMMIENIELLDGGDFDHSGKVLHLENDHEYYFLVRAVDALGNEDDNDIWVSGTPDGIPDPLDPEIVSLLDLPGSSQSANDVYVYDSIAYIGTSYGIRMVDCTDPTSPWYAGWYENPKCYGIEYHETQGYAYAGVVYEDYGLLVLDEPATPPDSMTVISQTSEGYDLADISIDGDICYLLRDYLSSGYMYVDILNIENPEEPALLSTVNLYLPNVYNINAHNGYVFCSTFHGMRVINATDPTAPNVPYHGPDEKIYDISFWGDYALVANGTLKELQVYDVSNPALPSLVGSMAVPEGVMKAVIARDDQYAYLGLSIGLVSQILVIDWSDIDNIQMVATVYCPSPKELFYDGEFLYVAASGEGLMIVF